MPDNKVVSTDTSVETKTEDKGDGVTVKTITTTTVEKYDDGSSSTKKEIKTITEGATMQHIDPATGKPSGKSMNISEAKASARKVPVTTDKKFLEDALKAHNDYRKRHGSQSMTLSSELCQVAQAWADKCAKDDEMQHSDNGYGENIHWCSGEVTKGSDPVEHWYSEVKDFDYKKMDYQKGTGHFTQVVWNDSNELGIAKATAKDGSTYVVANYNPSGNFLGKFKGNVNPPC